MYIKQYTSKLIYIQSVHINELLISLVDNPAQLLKYHFSQFVGMLSYISGKSQQQYKGTCTVSGLSNGWNDNFGKGVIKVNFTTS